MIEIHIQWIPAHRQINGNEIADRLAKIGSTLQQTTYIIPDPNIINKRTKLKIIKEYEEKTIEDIQQTYYGQQNPNNNKTRYFRDANRRLDTGLTRLRLGHTRLNTHLKRLGLVESDLCRFCELEPENIQHILLKCPRFYSHQLKFKENLKEAKISIDLTTILGLRNLNKVQKRILCANLKSFLIKTNVLEIL